MRTERTASKLLEKPLSDAYSQLGILAITDGTHWYSF